MVDSAEQQETSIRRRSIAMNIQEIYKKMCDGEEVEFSVVESDEDRQKWAGYEKKLLCRLRQDDMTVLLRVPSVKPFRFTGTLVKLNISSPEGFIDLKINPRFSQVLLDCNKGRIGNILEMEFMVNGSKSKSFIYEIYGGYDVTNGYHYPLVLCKKEYRCEGKIVHTDFSFKLDKQSVDVNLSEEINISSSSDRETLDKTSVHREISDKINVLVEMVSFCQSQRVNLESEKAMSGESVVYQRYTIHRFQVEFSPLYCPMRNSPEMRIDFLQHVWQKENVTYRWLIDRGIFQAIYNLYFDKTNEWMLIKLAAALEGLCKITEHNPIDNDRYKAIIECSLVCALTEIEYQREFRDISNEMLKQIKKNIEQNKRTLNGYPTRWYISKTLDDLKLKKFRKRFAWHIDQAFQIRNTIVHSGWAEADQWKVDLMEHIKILRKTIFLIVLAHLKYPGEFYFSGDEHEKPTSLQEWQS